MTEHQLLAEMPTPRLLRILPLLLALLLASSPEGVSGAGDSGSGNGTCPLDLSYVPTFPWDPTPCAGSAPNMTACCQTLLSVLGIGLAGRLRATGQFRLPSAGASAACLADLGEGISAPPASLPGASLVQSCFPSPDEFISSPSFCAGVTTAAEYRAIVGNDSVAGLNAACGADLASLPVCYRCLSAGIIATSRLIAADANATAESQRNCFYLTVMYAAGISSAEGPTSLSTANCTLGLGLSTPVSQPSKSNKAAIYYATTIPIAVILLLSALAFVWRKRRHAKTKNRNLSIPEEGSEERRPHLRPNTGSTLFGIAELTKGTDGFADRNLIGRGGFGVVYRGVLTDGSVVAVKKMLNPEMEGGDEEFTNEVEIISHLRHRNLVPLRGCCIVDDDIEDGKQMFLVYDYMPNGSLEDFIFRDGEGGSISKRPALTWAQRRSIIMDVAKGLEYLHYGVKPAIYHRDIKATNILLDGEMRARVADFGLARKTREGQSHLTTRVAGTHGYLAPEYALYGQLTEKSDVYSFGVLVLEILSARHVLDMSAQAGPVLITDWAWTLIKAGQSRDVLDKALSTGESPRGDVMERFVLVGILCAHVMVALRPTITEAVKMLEGDMDIPEIPDRPMPYGHNLMFSEAGSNFSASPAISGPLIDNGDMLR
ncbi:unnamed protein product [Alopecurus aequalis]